MVALRRFLVLCFATIAVACFGDKLTHDVLKNLKLRVDQMLANRAAKFQPLM